MEDTANQSLSSDPPNEAKPTIVRYMVLLLVAMASGSAYLTRYCISVANSTMQVELELTEVQMGIIFSSFSFGYLFFQIPGGALGNRFGTRHSLPILSVLWSVFTLWTAALSNFVPLLISRFAFGSAQAGLVPNTAKVIKDWFPVRRHGTASSVVGASMSIGGAITMWLTGWLLGINVYWRTIFAAYSVVGIVWAVAYYLIARTKPEEHPQVNAAEVQLIRGFNEPEHELPGHSISTARIVFEMMKSITMWAICVQSFFRAAGYLIFATWFPDYLEKAFSIGPEKSGGITAMMMIGVVIGSLAGGALVDWIFHKTKSKKLSRSGVSFIALALSGVFSLVASWTDTLTGLSVAMFVAALCSGVGSPPTWAATIDISGKFTTLGVGLMNMAGTLSGLTVPIGLGMLIGHINDTDGNWDLVLYLSAAFYFLAAASWLLVNPEKVVFEPEDCSDGIPSA